MPDFATSGLIAWVRMSMPQAPSRLRVPGSLRRPRRPHYLPILNILVPQVAQVPVVAGLPFFIVMLVGSFISFLALHLTQ